FKVFAPSGSPCASSSSPSKSGSFRSRRSIQVTSAPASRAASAAQWESFLLYEPERVLPAKTRILGLGMGSRESDGTGAGVGDHATFSMHAEDYREWPRESRFTTGSEVLRLMRADARESARCERCPSWDSWELSFCRRAISF